MIHAVETVTIDVTQTDNVCIAEVEWVRGPGQPVEYFDGSSKRASGEMRNPQLGRDLAVLRALRGVVARLEALVEGNDSGPTLYARAVESELAAAMASGGPAEIPGLWAQPVPHPIFTGMSFGLPADTGFAPDAKITLLEGGAPLTLDGVEVGRITTASVSSDGQAVECAGEITDVRLRRMFDPDGVNYFSVATPAQPKVKPWPEIKKARKDARSAS